MQHAPQVASHLGALVQLLLLRSAAFPAEDFKAQQRTRDDSNAHRENCTDYG